MVKLAYMLMLISVLACGKKAENSQTPSDIGQTLQPSDNTELEVAYKTLKDAVEKNNIALVKETVSKNPTLSLNELNENGETFLMYTIRKGFKELRNFFIEAKINLNKGNTVGKTPLIIAAETGMADSVHRLVDEKRIDDARVNLDLQDDVGNTALIAAIKAKQNAIALELLRNGANYKLKDHDHYSAYDLAERLNLEDVLDMLDLLIQTETGMPSAETFANLLKTGGVKTITNIITKFPDIVQKYESINPLVLILENQPMNSVPVLVTLLIANRANVNGPSNAQITPLVKAVQMDNIDYVKMFLSRKANAQILDLEGKSTLIHAIEKNNPETVELLRSWGLEKNYSTNVNGKKVKFRACTVTREVEKKLLDKADLDRNENIKDILKCGLRWLPFI